MTKKDRHTMGILLNDIIWQARRYCDGRYTYAPSMFNEAYDKLKEILGDEFRDHPKDDCIKDWPHAKEGKWSDLNNKYPKEI